MVLVVQYLKMQKQQQRGQDCQESTAHKTSVCFCGLFAFSEAGFAGITMFIHSQATDMTIVTKGPAAYLRFLSQYY